jgi:hypothetical protein
MVRSTAIVLTTARAKLDDALTQADNVLGVDNSVASNVYQPYLATGNPSLLTQARLNYVGAKAARDMVRSTAIVLTTASAKTDIDRGLNEAEKALGATILLLGSTSDVLANTAPGGALTPAILDGFKTSIQVVRAGITALNTTLVTTKQGIVNAKNSLSTYQIAYSTAVRALADTEASTAATIKIRQAAYDQAVANLQSKINPPRAVDVAYYRAALSQALASREKAFIRAPIAGQITKVGNLVGGKAIFGIHDPLFRGNEGSIQRSNPGTDYLDRSLKTVKNCRRQRSARSGISEDITCTAQQENRCTQSFLCLI